MLVTRVAPVVFEPALETGRFLCPCRGGKEEEGRLSSVPFYGLRPPPAAFTRSYIPLPLPGQGGAGNRHLCRPVPP